MNVTFPEVSFCNNEREGGRKGRREGGMEGGRERKRKGGKKQSLLKAAWHCRSYLHSRIKDVLPSQTQISAISVQAYTFF